MALDFPSSPTNGQTYTLGSKTWTYNASKGIWVLTNSGSGALLRANNLSDLDNAATARDNLGVVPLTALRGYINGLTLSNNVTDSTNDIDIAVGVACAADQSAILSLSSTLTKRLDAAWAVGTGNGGLDTGTIANTTYFVWLIRRSDTGVVDALFSTSASSPTMPTNYDQKRLIGAIMRVSGAIRAFSQYGDEFLYLGSVADVSGATGSTTASLATLSVPIGIKVQAILSVGGVADSVSLEDARFYISSPDASDEALGTSNYNAGVSSASTNAQNWQEMRLRTNTSGQIRYRASNSTAALFIGTRGFVMPRAQF